MQKATKYNARKHQRKVQNQKALSLGSDGDLLSV